MAEGSKAFPTLETLEAEKAADQAAVNAAVQAHKDARTLVTDRKKQLKEAEEGEKKAGKGVEGAKKKLAASRKALERRNPKDLKEGEKVRFLPNEAGAKTTQTGEFAGYDKKKQSIVVKVGKSGVVMQSRNFERVKRDGPEGDKDEPKKKKARVGEAVTGEAATGEEGTAAAVQETTDGDESIAAAQEIEAEKAAAEAAPPGESVGAQKIKAEEIKAEGATAQAASAGESVAAQKIKAEVIKAEPAAAEAASAGGGGGLFGFSLFGQR